MTDYAVVHDGKAYTPAGGVEAHNAQLEAAELRAWQTQPDRMLAYYRFPGEQGGKLYRTAFRPMLLGATVTTWLGTRLGQITAANVYRHNFGSRMVSLQVRGTNGARYSGRASWDGGDCIWLRRLKRKP